MIPTQSSCDMHVVSATHSSPDLLLIVHTAPFKAFHGPFTRCHIQSLGLPAPVYQRRLRPRRLLTGSATFPLSSNQAASSKLFFPSFLTCVPAKWLHLPVWAGPFPPTTPHRPRSPHSETFSVAGARQRQRRGARCL